MQPHHLQQSDRYLESHVAQRVKALVPFGWGVISMQPDRGLAEQGKFALSQIECVFPDGTPFCAPDIDALPAPFAVTSDQLGSGVWLTLPDRKPNDHSVDPEKVGITRYRLTDETVRDNASASYSEQRIQIAVPRVELTVRNVPPQDYQVIRLGEVQALEDGALVMSPDYVPPALTLSVNDALKGYLSSVIGWVEAQIAGLARFAADPTAGGGLMNTDFMKLAGLNGAAMELRHLERLRILHPERLYTVLVRLAGELSTFDFDARTLPDYPLGYRHDDLRGSFAPVLSDIQRLLSAPDQRPIRLELDRFSENAFVTVPPEGVDLSNALMVIEVASNLGRDEVAALFPSLCKIGPTNRMDAIVNRGEPGVPIEHLPNPPRQIRVLPTNVYFSLANGHPLFAEMLSDAGIGLHFAGDWPGLELNLFAVTGATL